MSLPCGPLQWCSDRGVAPWCRPMRKLSCVKNKIVAASTRSGFDTVRDAELCQSLVEVPANSAEQLGEQNKRHSCDGQARQHIWHAAIQVRSSGWQGAFSGREKKGSKLELQSSRSVHLNRYHKYIGCRMGKTLAVRYFKHVLLCDRRRLSAVPRHNCERGNIALAQIWPLTCQLWFSYFLIHIWCELEESW